jgi:nucleotide-binding universal stress UspA family protein
MVMLENREVRNGGGSTDPGPWVVGIDGSDGATTALQWAAAQLEGRATRLELVMAWQAPVVAAPMSTPAAIPFDDHELRDAAAQDLRELAASLEVSMPVEAQLGHGSAAEVLLAAAADAAVLVVGNRGRGGFARLLLGSTSTQCATHAVVPTIVIPPDTPAGPCTKIVVGFDGSANATAALHWAVCFADPGATVEAVWVWDATPLAVGADAFFFPDASDLAVERFNHLVEPAVDRADARGVRLERSFIRGTARSVLAEAATGADLVVVGARGHGTVGAAVLGSVSTWLLHHVDQPVAVIPFAGSTDEPSE